MKNQRWWTVLDLGFLAFFFWIARYWHSIHFGLYEDDLTIIPDAFTRSVNSLVQYIFSYIVHLYGHARPLSDSFIYFFSWIGWHLSGLFGIYLIGYIITVINICLFYWLMRRISNRTFAFVAALGYILYSADTTQVFLTHSLGVQPSFIFLFLALHSYLSNKRVLSYFLAFLILFSYELPFVLFLIAPLLTKNWNKTLLKELFFHTLIIVLMIGGIFILRSFIGEGRIAGLGLKDIILTPIIHMVQGPVVSLGSFVLRPVQVLSSLNLEIVIVIILSFGILAFVFSRLEVESTLNWRSLWRVIRDRDARRVLPEPVKMLGRLLVTGAALLILAYPLTFTVRAYAISGRDTRVHAAAVVGAAIIVACLVYLIFLMVQKRWRWLTNLVLAGFFALMVGYGFVIQNDYVRAWQLQKDFWRELLPLINDAGDETVILVDPAALTDTRQIGANYWNLPRVLDQIYNFPPKIKDIPRVHRLETGWENKLVTSDGKFQVNAISAYSVPDYFGEFNPENVILIQRENGQLVRRQVVTLNNRGYQLKQFDPGMSLSNLQPGFLYNLMIASPEK
jgi:hypothetical protein